MGSSLAPGLRILLTNNTLANRAGSELYVCDLAIALMKLGHFPVAYSPVLGEVADELKRATIPVIDDLHSLNAPPDLIHGQHHLETMTAVIRFPRTPALFACHGWMPWEELPPLFPTILRYVAVDELCRERLLTTKGIPSTRISTIYNFVDLERFKQRAAWQATPKSALIFSNRIDEPAARAIRAACLRAGIERVDAAGLGCGNSIPNPASILGGYDVVFAKARCAIEAMACGCAVIVADFSGLAGMVTTGNVERMRRLNFGVRTMQAGAVTEEGVLRELGRYDPGDARRVSEWIRVEADMSSAVASWLSLYADALAEWREEGSHNLALSDQQWLAAADYLRWLAPVVKSRDAAEQGAHEAVAAQAALTERLAASGAESASRLRDAEAAQAALAAELAARDAALAEKSQETAAAQTELARFRVRNSELSADIQAVARARDYLASALMTREIEPGAMRPLKVWKALSKIARLTAGFHKS